MPIVLSYFLFPTYFREARIFPGYSHFFSLFPGLTGQFLRGSFYRLSLSSCSQNCCISFGTIFSSAKASIGEHVYIGPNCMIGDIEIERDTLIGSNVSIINGARQHGISRLDIPIREQEGEYPKITIGQDTWIGDRSILMANVGNHCVIGAGSVVTKDVPDYSIAFGNPARVVRHRHHSQKQQTSTIPESTDNLGA